MHLLPSAGALAATYLALLAAPIVTGRLAFGLIALLFLVTEALLVEAH
jgi:ZIP family zinc transporter